MLQEIQDSRPGLQTELWRAGVRSYLLQRAAMRATEIAERLGVAELIVRQCLEQYEHAGQVEVLRPVGHPPGAAPHLDYFRWRRADDDRYRWQAELRRQRVETLSSLIPRQDLLREFA